MADPNVCSLPHAEMQDNRPEEGVKLHTKGRLVNAASTEVDGDVFWYRGGSTGVVKFLEPFNPLLNYFEARTDSLL